MKSMIGDKNFKKSDNVLHNEGINIDIILDSQLHTPLTLAIGGGGGIDDLPTCGPPASFSASSAVTPRGLSTKPG